LSVGILGAVGCEGKNSRLSHYHETSGLAQMREELVHTTRYIYEILHCHTETREPHREALAPNIQILNIEAMREAPISAGDANMDGEWQDINIHNVLDGTIPLDISHAGGEFAALSDAILSDMTQTKK
jgi:hypothetical protein